MSCKLVFSVPIADATPSFYIIEPNQRMDWWCLYTIFAHIALLYLRLYIYFVVFWPVAVINMYLFHSGVEDAFYNLKLRLNGQKLTKKSKMVSRHPLVV